MDHRKLFAGIHRRPQLYGLDGSYHDYCTFLLGVDAGTAGGLLVGFREFLVPRAGTGDNLTWPSLVLHLAFPGRTTGRHDEAAGEGQGQAVDRLFALLAEFLDRRETAGGTVAVFEEYLAWRNAQSWHRPQRA